MAVEECNVQKQVQVLTWYDVLTIWSEGCLYGCVGRRFQAEPTLLYEIQGRLKGR